MKELTWSQANLYDNPMTLHDDTGVVHFIVGGVNYSIERSELDRFPDCYLSVLLKDEWKCDRDAPVAIDRDGILFRYIYNNIYSGHYEIAKHKSVRLQDLIAIKSEADFYNLPGLIPLCDKPIVEQLQSVCQADNFSTKARGCYHCIMSNESQDHLVNWLRCIRPAAMRTNSIQHPPVRPVDSDATRTRLVVVRAEGWEPSVPLATEAYHNCADVTASFDLYRIATGFVPVVKKWPMLACMNGARGLRINMMRVHEYTVGGFCTGRAHIPSHDAVGTLLCVCNSAYTGGEITCNVLGTFATISKPGNILALQAGCTYTVDVVTSGSLLLLELDIEKQFVDKDDLWSAAMRSFDFIVPTTATEESDCDSECDYAVAQTVAEEPDRDLLDDTSDENALLSSVVAELVRFSGVVICLNKYYNVTHTNTDELFATDCESLTGNDASLYRLLDQHYDIRLVTVYVGYCTTDNDLTHTQGYVLDALLEEDEKIEILVPLYGFGETFECTRDSGLVYGTILTGIYVKGPK